jgi:hypothetical protein
MVQCKTSFKKISGMNDFKSFGIKPSTDGFKGDKISLDRIFNRTIIVEKYKIETSKFDKGNGKCLCLQIMLGEIQYIVFSGSSVLMELIERIPKDGFPFTTTIVKNNGRHEFT